jgi:hypothetical protein
MFSEALNPFKNGTLKTKASQALKLSLQTALALSLPTQDHFQLYVYEKWGTALGVLTQLQGPTPQPAKYLSKELDCVKRVAWVLKGPGSNLPP